MLNEDPTPSTFYRLLPILAVSIAAMMLPFLATKFRLAGYSGRALAHRLMAYEVAMVGVSLAITLLLLKWVPGATAGLFSHSDWNRAVSPVPWLGLGTKAGTAWRQEIIVMALFITAVTFTFVARAAHAQFSWERALSLLPWIIGLAALNAVAEEWLYRVAVLRVSLGPLGPEGAAWLSAVLFGLAHLGGMPGGIPGALAAGLLGFVLARCTLETGGISLAWMVHLIQDVVIFGGWLGASRPPPP